LRVVSRYRLTTLKLELVLLPVGFTVK
jgi:hypothetical protein